MPWLKVRNRTHHRREKGRIVRYERGDTFFGSESEAINFADKLSRIATPEGRIELPGSIMQPPVSPQARKEVAAEDDSGGQGKANGGAVDGPPDLDSDLTVPQLRKLAEDLGVPLPSKATKPQIRKLLDDAIARM